MKEIHFKYIALIFVSVLFFNCSNNNAADDVTDPQDDTTTTDDDPLEENLYFPPISGNEWETVAPETLEWDTSLFENFQDYLVEKNTDAFLVLYNGRIAIEWYFNNTNSSTSHPWNSAGKTLTSFTLGQAQQNGHLSLNDATTTFLGEGWTNMTPEEEVAIKIKHQLTMTCGGDYTVENTNCTDPECLLHLNQPGDFWYYHNAFYTLLQPVMNAAIPEGFDSFFEENLKNPIGMSGAWIELGYHRVFFSNARSMARFGLLNLNRGIWEDTEMIDSTYFNEMTNTSQEHNKSYGYLWWLNGKESYRVPASTELFPGKLIPNAPNDLFAGLGANDKKLYIVPSEKLVVVRLGGSAGEELLGPSSFDNEIWQRLMEVIN